MKDKQNPAEIKSEAMNAWLLSIGFQQIAESGHSLVFRHVQSGSVVTLTRRDDSEFVRPADVLSIRVRLESEALVTDDAIEELRRGRLPIAS